MEKQKRTYRKYDESFKREAVQLALHGDRTERSIASDLGINSNLLNRWKRIYLSKGSTAFPGKGHLSELETENQRLRKELRDVTEEREILKKATAFFSRISR